MGPEDGPGRRVALAAGPSRPTPGGGPPPPTRPWARAMDPRPPKPLGGGRPISSRPGARILRGAYGAVRPGASVGVLETGRFPIEGPALFSFKRVLFGYGPAILGTRKSPEEEVAPLSSARGARPTSALPTRWVELTFRCARSISASRRERFLGRGQKIAAKEGSFAKARRGVGK